MRLAGPAAFRPRRPTLSLHLYLHLLGALLLHLLLHLLGALLLQLLLHLLGALLLHLLGALLLQLLGALLLQLLVALLLQLLLGDRGPRRSWRKRRRADLARLALLRLNLLARQGMPGKRMRGLLPRLELPRQGVFRTTRRKARLSRPSLARKRGDLTRRKFGGLLARQGLPGKRMRGLLPRLELPRQGVFRTTRRKARLSRPSLARKRGRI